MTASTAIEARRRRRYANLPLLIGSALTGAFILIALVSLFYTPHDPNFIDVDRQLLPAGSPGYPLGTDFLGRDVVSQLMAGAGTSLLIASAAATTSLLLGVVFGVIAAVRGGVIDEILMRTADIFLAMPGVITALVLAATIGSGPMVTTIALITFFVPSFARVTRAAAIAVLGQDYVSAARLYGRARAFIVIRHVIPNIVSVLIVQFTLSFAAAVLVEASLSYLGVGIVRPSISWGLMLIEAQAQVGISSPLAIWPGLTIVVCVVGLNLLGDGLRDRFDPKYARRR
jgi:peptide/nickel transport system permease protein